MFILGIDPGLSRCGFGLIEFESDNNLLPSAKYAGVITTNPNENLEKRLLSLSLQLTRLFNEYLPDEVAVERVFFVSNAKTAMSVGQAGGIVLMHAARIKAGVFQYSANEVKQSVCGNGRAQKLQVQKMISKLFNLEIPPSPPDVADALALAYCHYKARKVLNSLSVYSKL